MSLRLYIICSDAEGDIRLRDELIAHLFALRAEGLKVFYSGMIDPGEDVHARTDKELHIADIIIALLSKDLLASKAYSLLELAITQMKIILPVCAHPCIVTGTCLEGRMSLFADRPIGTIVAKGGRDRAWVAAIQRMQVIINPSSIDQNDKILSSSKLAYETRVTQRLKHSSVPKSNVRTFIENQNSRDNIEPASLIYHTGGLPSHVDEVRGRQQQKDELLASMQRCSPVQLLGEMLMGKTWLLEWARQNAPGGWAVAWINAMYIDGRSPSALVCAIADRLGRRPESEALFALHRKLPEVRAAERVLEQLLPPAPDALLLLVDEAQELARHGHAFDRDFFSTLRALGQAKRCLWISTSRNDLYALFKQSGLTSQFLNDARKIWVGQLNAKDADALVLPLGDKCRAAVRRAAGGHAYALQRLGEHLATSMLAAEGVAEQICDELISECTNLFGAWWQPRTKLEQQFLVSCARGEGTSIRPLDDRTRQRARDLVRCGLLEEFDNHFHIPGEAWRRFLLDQQGP